MTRDPAASRDADLVARMRAAGGPCLGALNMGEFAYGFTGENAHHGPFRNPHDPTRMSGGPSLRCGAATAAGFPPILITNSESSALHLPSLRRDAGDLDPDARDRFLAGAMLLAEWLQAAQRVRRQWLGEALQIFRRVDVLVLPAMPVPAPRIGDRSLDLARRRVPLRLFMGLLAQPFSCIGLPVVTVPVLAPDEAPIGVPVIGPPWREGALLRLAHRQEIAGAVAARRTDIRAHRIGSAVA